MLWFLLDLHTGQLLTENTIPDAVVPSQPAHRTVTYREYYTRRCGSFSTCTPDSHLHRILYQMLWFLLNLHTGRSLTQNTIYDAVVPSQPAHRKVTYTEYYTRRCGSCSTRTPDCHLQRILYQTLWFLLNLHTGRSLTENTITDAVVPSQPAHRTVTYTDYYNRCCFLLNLHTGRSLAENTITDAVVPSQTAHHSFSTCTPGGHLHRILYQTLWFLLNLHTGRSLTQNTIPDAVVPSQPAHRTVTYTEYYTRCCGSFSTCTPDGHLHRILYQTLWFLLNPHTGHSLAENIL